ncbi:alpha-(1,6)-fucosyltransferase-like [Panonychus citri]|uniref:alpha-(1,6)-fucosyltransferase-like n=1 Tax=Panonychus citri TaxID=50023 RepID=UPI0023076A58|nr:alpha-(1,6)-fucosyltransferase-like [Panonychus citri]
MALNFAYAGRVLVGVVFVWLLLIFFIGGPLLKRTEGDYSLINSENGELILARLSRATSELDSLKAQNEELRNLLQNYIPLDFQLNKASDLLKDSNGPSPQLPLVAEAQNQNLQSPLSSALVPSLSSSSPSSVPLSSPFSSVPNLKYEQARRRLSFSYNELAFFLNNQFKHNTTLLKFVNEHRASFMYDLGSLSDRDYEWRKNELKKLTKFFLDVVDKLQNPVDCATANKLVCRLNKGCGFGCQMHHVSYCMVVALATQRTMIIDSNNWRYVSNQNAHGTREPSWNLIFQPISRTCLTAEGKSRKPWSDGSTAQVRPFSHLDSNLTQISESA